MTPQQILDARTDPNLGPVLGNKAITWLAQRNAGVLGNSGIAPTGVSLGIAHYVGPGAAASIMAAPDNAPVSSFVGADAVKANPELATMTVGQMKQRYANVPSPGFLKPAGSTTAAQPPVPAARPGGPPAVPAAPPGTIQGTPDTGGAQFAGPGAKGGAVTPPSAAVPGDVGAIIGGMKSAGAAPTTLAPGVAAAGPAAPTAVAAATPPPAQDTRPDSELTWEEFKARHGSPITPAQTAALTITPDPQLLQQAQSSMQTAAQNLQQARLSGNDDAANKAQADFEAARKNVADLKQQAAQNTATNIQKAQEAQDTLLSGQLAEARRLAATAAENDKQRAAAVDLAQLQAKLKAQENVQTSQLASRAKVLDQLDTDATSAHENLTQLQLVKQLSDAAGQPGVLASYPELRSWLTKLDIATPEQTQQWSAQQALEAATNKLTLAQRAGSGMSRVTNMDLQFLQHASPQSFNPQDWRNAQISYLQTLYQRQQQFAGLVHRGVADGMPLTDAQNAADKELGPTIKQRPSVLNGQPLDNIGQARWNFDNLEPGQFYKDEAGHLRIFTPGDATRP
jgi:hypothetical protein